MATVARASQRTGDATLRRVSQDLAIARNSVKVARSSLGQAAPADLEGGAGGVARVQETIKSVERALAAAPAEERPAIQKELDSLNATLSKMANVDKVARSQQ